MCKQTTKLLQRESKPFTTSSRNTIGEVNDGGVTFGDEELKSFTARQSRFVRLLIIFKQVDWYLACQGSFSASNKKTKRLASEWRLFILWLLFLER